MNANLETTEATPAMGQVCFADFHHMPTLGANLRKRSRNDDDDAGTTPPKDTDAPADKRQRCDAVEQSSAACVEERPDDDGDEACPNKDDLMVVLGTNSSAGYRPHRKSDTVQSYKTPTLPRTTVSRRELNELFSNKPEKFSIEETRYREQLRRIEQDDAKVTQLASSGRGVNPFSIFDPQMCGTSWENMRRRIKFHRVSIFKNAEGHDNPHEHGDNLVQDMIHGYVKGPYNDPPMETLLSTARKWIVKEWPTHSNVKCWNCCKRFKWQPFLSPTVMNEHRIRDETANGFTVVLEVVVFGNFCLPTCAARYDKDHNGGANIEMIWRLASIVYPPGTFPSTTTMAPPRYAHKDFGGEMDTDEYRQCSLDGVQVELRNIRVVYLESTITLGIPEGPAVPSANERITEPLPQDIANYLAQRHEEKLNAVAASKPKAIRGRGRGRGRGQ